jgi:hypothetical protein
MLEEFFELFAPIILFALVIAIIFGAGKAMEFIHV